MNKAYILFRHLSDITSIPDNDNFLIKQFPLTVVVEEDPLNRGAGSRRFNIKGFFAPEKGRARERRVKEEPKHEWTSRPESSRLGSARRERRGRKDKRGVAEK